MYCPQEEGEGCSAGEIRSYPSSSVHQQLRWRMRFPVSHAVGSERTGDWDEFGSAAFMGVLCCWHRWLWNRASGYSPADGERGACLQGAIMAWGSWWCFYFLLL